MRQDDANDPANADDPSSTASSPDPWNLGPAAINELLSLINPSPRSREDLSTAAETIARDQRMGRFEIRRFLGHGGFGIVYLAFDPMLQREVALKIPRLEVILSKQHRERFVREAQTLAALDHPGIIPVFEAGEEGGVTYIATGYCPGPTLGDWLHERAMPVPARRAAQWMIALADAVQHAHQRGVLHRDLKPTNVLLEPMNAAAESEFAYVPRITDFGLAKQIGDEAGMTARDGLVGTPPYLAPEQALRRPKEITVRTDVYSLGAILYHMLAGRPPFDAEEEGDVLRQVIEQNPAPLPTGRQGVPKDLATVCFKCLEKEPAARYASAAELVADLRRFLDGEPVQARPVPGWVRAWHWYRRRPAFAALSLSLVLAVVIGITAVLWQWRRAEQYALAVEQSLVQAEQGLVNMAWVLQEMNYGAESTDPFQVGNREQLLEHYRRMLARPTPSKPSLTYAATMESFRARVAELSNDPTAAAAHFESSIRLWDDLVRANPLERDYRQALVLNLFSYGAHLTRFGDTKHPLARPHRDFILFPYLVSLEPDRGLIAADFVDFLIQRAKTLVRLDQARQAHGYFSLAHAMAHLVVEKYPDDPRNKRLFAHAAYFLACSERRVGRRERAIDLFSEANQWLDLVMHSEVPTAEDLFLRADASRLQAACMRDADRTEEAVTMFETALHFLQKREEMSDPDPSVWNLTASTTENLAQIYAKQGKPTHSRLNWERFCEATEKSMNLGSATEGDVRALPMILLQLAKEDLREGKQSEARVRLERACAVFERLDAREVAKTERRFSWSEALGLMAQLAEAEGDRSKARKCHKRAIEVLEVAKGDGHVEQKLETHRSAVERLRQAENADR